MADAVAIPAGGMSATLERQFDLLRSEVSQLAAKIAGLEVSARTTENAVMASSEERAKIWVEIRGVGVETVKLSNEVKNLASAFARIEPVVERSEADLLIAKGAGKFAIVMTKVLWAVGGAAVAGVASLITFLASRGAPPTGP